MYPGRGKDKGKDCKRNKQVFKDAVVICRG